MGEVESRNEQGRISRLLDRPSVSPTGHKESPVSHATSGAFLLPYRLRDILILRKDHTAFWHRYYQAMLI
jgi:hypothetical protein